MAIAVCSGCGSGEGGKPRGEDIQESMTGWRLVHTEASFPSYWRGDALGFVVGRGDSSITYDSANDIARIDSYYLAPTFFAFNYTDNQISNFRTIAWDEIYTLESEPNLVVIESSLERPYFNEGELISSVEYINTSASSWTQIIVSRNKTWEFTSTNDPCSGEIIKDIDAHIALIDPNDPNSGFELIEEDIERCVITTELILTQDIADWGETLIQETIAPSTSIPITDTIVNSPQPKPAPSIREFNTNGKLRKLTQFTVVNGNDSAPSLVAEFTYNEQNQLSLLTIEKTDYYFNQTVDGPDWFSVSSEFEPHYHSPSPGLVVAEIYQITDSGSLKINEVTATYENQPCGELTKERDRNQIPALFPMCL